jgi:hypothetical protein
VHQKKRKSVDSTNSGKTVSKALRRGGINWEPAFPEGEDEHSIKQHQSVMQTEWKKRSPDVSKIENRMLVTFPHRRRLINDKTPLVQIKEEYPALFSFKQVQYSILLQYLLFTACIVGVTNGK